MSRRRNAIFLCAENFETSNIYRAYKSLKQIPHFITNNNSSNRIEYAHGKGLYV